MPVERIATTQIPTEYIGSPTSGGVKRTMNYYDNSPSYLTGPLKGTCHFGYTPPGERFELESSLFSMEILLGKTLNLPHGSKVLDAGCGYGRVATTLCKQFGYDVIGIDLMQERLKEASRYTGDHGVFENVTLVRGNYCELPLADSSVSGVYTMESLVHADPLEEVLGEFWRVLKPGGRLVLFEYSVPDHETLDPIRRRITDNMVDRTGMASIGRFTHGSFPSLLEEADFKDVTVKDISRNVWPTWRWLFRQAVFEHWSDILRGQFKENTNLAGSLLIWPYRHQLGYNVVTAIKPDAHS